MGAFLTRSLANRKKAGPLSLLLTVSPHISGISCLFPLSTRLYLTRLRFGDQTKNFQALSGSSPIFFFFLLFLTIPILGKLKAVRQSL